MKKVAILIGSVSDKDVVMAAKPYFEYFGIEWELHVSSAHRNPDDVAKFAKNARQNGYGCLIGGAGMAAHLAGAVAAHSTKPVIGIPIESGGMGGIDSLLSTAMMPPGVPVATVAVGKSGAKNSAILAVQILATSDDDLARKLKEYKENMRAEVLEKDKQLNS